MRCDGAEVARLRRELGITQLDLADKAKVSKTTIERIERGIAVDYQSIHQIAPVLGVGFNDLIRPEGREAAGPEAAFVPLRSLGSARELMDVLLRCDTAAVDLVDDPAEDATLAVIVVLQKLEALLPGNCVPEWGPYLPATNVATLDRLFVRLHANKPELPMVLDRPEIPLHTNGSERDIRLHVTKRKVSGGIRSADGRRLPRRIPRTDAHRAKLGIAFWDYLGDRLQHSRADHSISAKPDPAAAASPPERNCSGVSPPLFSALRQLMVIDAEDSGKIVWRVAGVISEGKPDYDYIVATRADVIQDDGRITE